MELVRVRVTLPREKPPLVRPEPPRRLRRFLASRAFKYALRALVFLMIVLAVLFLFPGQAE